ncbi:MAG: 2Fe-2S iron-sulfur cluster binding domain-containing protein [Firmicutes bacterium]|nr:2Fe-2S iron-sulfur cluster binding domain-containing protein [Bacillota bacterium]
MSMVTLTIDGQKVEIEQGATILDAARKAGINIPTLCFLEDINEIGACRICVVEVKGAKALQAACVAPVGNNMEVFTNSPDVRAARRTTLELILSNHRQECLTCIRNQNCELQSLAEAFGIRNVRFEGAMSKHPIDDSSPSLVRDPEKCVLCRRCIAVCEKIQTVNAIGPHERGFDMTIAPPFDLKMAEGVCTNCGQCVLVCPVAALHEKDQIEQVWAALSDPSKHVVVQTAPATRVSLGEALGMDQGSIVTGKMVAALRRMGFDKVFDTDFTADLTIMEEGYELIGRIKEKGVLPLVTSCSPGWIKFMEHFYPDLVDNISTCKSPQQMFGALAKTYYAEKMGIHPRDMFVVSIMPCTAKKYEAQRPEMSSTGYPDIDVVLTVRELARMIKQAGLNFEMLPSEEYDAPFGITTGAGLIFGATGGVMEAALRTAYEVLTGKTLEKIDFEGVRGLQGVKEAVVDVDGLKVKVAVAHGLGNARKVLDLVKAKKAGYHFIEIMCCPGGCIGGGGQPIPTNTEIREKRIKAIYQADRQMKLRKSHENPAVQELYKQFLGHPLGHKSHELLHTHYTPRGQYKSLCASD